MDVMDGHFVPNITMGAPVLEWIHKAIPQIKMDCHMMVSNPLQVSIVIKRIQSKVGFY